MRTPPNHLLLQAAGAFAGPRIHAHRAPELLSGVANPIHLLIRSLLIAVLCLTGCASKQQGANELIAQASSSEFGDSAYGCFDTIEVAAKAGVDYKKTVDRAMRRDEKSLHTLFGLTANAGFDAASSEGNAAVLGSLLRYLGDGTFGTALSAEVESNRNAVLDELRYDFGVGNGVKEEWLIEWYPITFGQSANK